MYQGKHLAPKAKKKIAASRRKRKATLILSLVLILGAAIGGTMAYFTDNTASNSEFSVGQVSCTVSQSGDTYAITNNGTVPACIRATVVVNWADENGTVHWTKPSANISFDANTWTAHNGYYYCNSVVAANTSVTGPVVTISEPAPDGYTAKIQVLVEAVQENSDAWDFTPSGN